MQIRPVPFRLRPATPEQVQHAARAIPGVLPVLPPWAPQQRMNDEGQPVDDQGEPCSVWSEAERAARREQLAVREAAQGPFDGQSGRLSMVGGEPPQHFIPDLAPSVRYVFDGQDALGCFIYRYDPTCAAHPQLIGAVTEAYAEVSAQYAAEAQRDDEHAIAYGERQGEAGA